MDSPINQPEQSQVQMQKCTQCLSIQLQSKLIYMAEFASYICQQCYQQQSTALMLYKQSKPTLYPSVDLIVQGIYLGNQDSACHQPTIKQLNISAVSVCGDYLLTPYTQTLQYQKYQISDSPNQSIIHLFDISYEWISKMRKQQKNILVHCAAGVSRSASFVIAYLMRSQQLSYIEAYKLVKQKRPIIRPNSGFVKQLYQYEKKCLLQKYQEIMNKNESNKNEKQLDE